MRAAARALSAILSASAAASQPLLASRMAFAAVISLSLASLLSSSTLRGATDLEMITEDAEGADGDGILSSAAACTA
eukprot:CAMPEP_0174727320 /NCGR_PEP_ID=MMETSP1094-20130205/49563_1 /TAXON_ID=156173 /ORGANISM="Chrysochromulina brevifilum, Strain UTEX LB 985" /LENGTH=76 /DNA_ID=CAMNT_0015929037 /DNA_START=169 /DNA_END=399 /DNA_ORIENTATION=+